MQVTFMKDSRGEDGKLTAVPWPGEVITRMANGVRIRFLNKDGEQLEYFVPTKDIIDQPT